MPIKIQADLPACSILENENIFVMTESRAKSQDIRPLKIAIVNLMPTKIATETQLLRLLANTPIQINISLVNIAGHVSKHIGQEHLERFYISSKKIFSQKFDGMIITGAPVEQLDFEKVDYWQELCKIFDFCKENVFSTLYICWAAQAALFYRYGIEKKSLEQKKFGIFKNLRAVQNEPLLRGFDDVFPMPISRHTKSDKNAILKNSCLTILAKDLEDEPSIIKSLDNRQIFITGHLEYDAKTLEDEYLRDLSKNLKISLPENYYPQNDSSLSPQNVWRSTAHLFFSNWLNYYVYQETPYKFLRKQKDS